ncbi:MAG: MFS transporter, partial [Pseudomonadota bacterium]
MSGSKPDTGGGVAMKFGALLASAALLIAGNALQNTLIGVRATIEGFDAVFVGVAMAGFFFGYVIGALACPRLIDRVGHIRAFAVLATVSSAAALAHPVYPDVVVWTLLRILTGACIAGLLLVVESWLNGKVANAGRGQLLSIYFMLNYGVTAASQYFLLLAPASGYELFILASVLLSFAVAPVGVTTETAPAPPPRRRLSLSKLYAVSPLAVVGCFLVGVTNGAFWSLGPVYAVGIDLAPSAVSLLMSAIVVGGMLAQAPIGRLSDRVDRRWVIVGGALCLSTSAAPFALGVLEGGPAFFVVAVILGGFLLTQYALCVAHANDFAEPGDFVLVSSGLLLVFGIGASIGPLLAGAAMDLVGPRALFMHIILFALINAAFGIWRMTARAAPASAQAAEFAPSPVAAAPVFDPRAER